MIRVQAVNIVILVSLIALLYLVDASHWDEVCEVKHPKIPKEPIQPSAKFLKEVTNFIEGAFIYKGQQWGPAPGTNYEYRPRKVSHPPKAPYIKYPPKAPYIKYPPKAPYIKYPPKAPYVKYPPKAPYIKVPYNGNCPGVRTRKDYRQLTAEEMNTFHECLQLLKQNTGDTGYDALARQHEFANAPTAHLGVAFLPWHRHYLFVFEEALREVGDKCRCITIPYWDSACDQPLPSPADAATWTDEYWGSASSGPVTDGQLCPNWVVTSPDCQDAGSIVSRGLTGNADDLYSRDTIMSLFTANTFEELTTGEFGDMSMFEANHGTVHCFVGTCQARETCTGHMGCVACSPNDPMFLLHHSFVDYLWFEWQIPHGGINLYPLCPDVNNCVTGGCSHCPDSDMLPFPGIRNIDGMRDDYYARYQERPSLMDCESDADCLSPKYLLWCDTDECFCKAKVKEGGDCTGLPHNACYCSQGRGGICRGNRCTC